MAIQATHKYESDTSRRKQLINSTIQTIAESGLSAVTLAKIASQAGLSPGIVNFYFKSKKQLLLDTLKYIDQEYLSVVAEHLSSAESPCQKLQAYIQASFDERVFVKEKIAVWYAFWSESQAREEYRQICGENDSQENQQILKFFTDLLADSEHSLADIEALALGLEGMIDSLWQQALYDSNEVGAKHAIDICNRFINLVKPNSVDSVNSVNGSELTNLLPPWTYRNEEFLDLEIERLFKPNWMLVGHVSDIPHPGNYLTFEGFNERAFVIRDSLGKINAFHNVCRHRGSKLLKGEGRCTRALVCPFHGWRYDFDGQLQFIPGQKGFPEIDKKDHGLVHLDLEIWKGFIFIRFDSGGDSLAKQLQPIEQEIEEYRLEELQPYGDPESHNYPVNWKIFHDIDNEGYHVPIGHPSLQQLYGQHYVDSYVDEIPVSHGRFNKRIGELWSVKHYRNLMTDFDHLSEDRKNLWLYFGVFPNLVFALYPDLMEIYMSIPIDLKHTRIISRVYVLPDSRRETKVLRYLNRRINRTTDYEDRSYMITLQEGLNSSVFPKLNLSKIAETGVGAFHNLIQEKLPVARLVNQPQSGTVYGSNERLAKTDSQQYQ